MSEVCILYTLFSRERTVYSVRKEISDLLGLYTVPSHGTIYPSLKRLTGDGYVSVRDVMSEGGKKSCYFSLTDKGRKLFTKLMLADYSENPSVFLNDLRLRICMSEKLSSEKKEEFFDKTKKFLELYVVKIDDMLNNRFLNPDETQKTMYLNAKREALELIKISDNLR